MANVLLALDINEERDNSLHAIAVICENLSQSYTQSINSHSVFGTNPHVMILIREVYLHFPPLQFQFLL